jgi:hypothetical protein
MIKSPCLPAQATHGKPLLGISTLIRMFYLKQDITPAWDGLMARITAQPEDISALMDMSLLLQSTGPKGLEVQAAAIKLQPIFHCVHGTGEGLRVLAIMTAGDMAANTPIDFLLEGSDMTLYLVYVDADTKALPPLPECDVAFMAVGESPANQPVLANVARLLENWSGPPILNGNPKRIAELTRDCLHNLLADEPTILSPQIKRLSHDDLTNWQTQGVGYRDPLLGLNFPLVIRPAGTHAGDGMEKLNCHSELANYLSAHPQPEFYLSEFINYADQDGLYRKQRVAVINGQCFASHHAVSENWMVHYLTASMDKFAARRDEESQWMRVFETEFVPRYADAFAKLAAGFDLNYFVVDSAELPDGRLLVFEADVIMIVHDMDPKDLFPYKRPVMRKLLDAFQSALMQASGKFGCKASFAEMSSPKPGVSGLVNGEPGQCVNPQFQMKREPGRSASKTSLAERPRVIQRQSRI